MKEGRNRGRARGIKETFNVGTQNFMHSLFTILVNGTAAYAVGQVRNSAIMFALLLSHTLHIHLTSGLFDSAS